MGVNAADGPGSVLKELLEGVDAETQCPFDFAHVAVEPGQIGALLPKTSLDILELPVSPPEPPGELIKLPPVYLHMRPPLARAQDGDSQTERALRCAQVKRRGFSRRPVAGDAASAPVRTGASKVRPRTPACPALDEAQRLTDSRSTGLSSSSTSLTRYAIQVSAGSTAPCCRISVSKSLCRSTPSLYRQLWRTI